MTTSQKYPVTEPLEPPHGRLAYDVRGDGPLSVASPGIGDRRQSFRFLVDDLAAGGFRVATVDLRGHGESTTIGGPADVLMVDDAGHYPHAEHPEVVSPAVRAFLERTLPRTDLSAPRIVARS